MVKRYDVFVIQADLVLFIIEAGAKEKGSQGRQLTSLASDCKCCRTVIGTVIEKSEKASAKNNLIACLCKNV